MASQKRTCFDRQLDKKFAQQQILTKLSFMKPCTFPVVVEPVNENLVTRLLLRTASVRMSTFLREHVTVFITPDGKPASSASFMKTRLISYKFNDTPILLPLTILIHLPKQQSYAVPKLITTAPV